MTIDTPYAIREVGLICKVIDQLRSEYKYGQEYRIFFMYTITDVLKVHPDTPGSSPQLKILHVNQEMGFRRLGSFLKAFQAELGIMCLGKKGNRYAYRMVPNASALPNIERIANNQVAQLSIHPAEIEASWRASMAPKSFQSMSYKQWGLIFDLLAAATDWAEGKPDNKFKQVAPEPWSNYLREFGAKEVEDTFFTISDHVATLPKPFNPY